MTDAPPLLLAVPPIPGDSQRVVRLVEEVRALTDQLWPGRGVDVRIPGPAPRLEVRVDPRQRAITLDGRRLQLTHKEHELLALFVASPGRAFTRAQLLQQVWRHTYVDVSGGRTVDVHVTRLRAKLGPARARLETIRGYGYRWV